MAAVEEVMPSAAEPADTEFSFTVFLLIAAGLFAVLWALARLRLNDSREEAARLSKILDSLNVYVYQKDLQGRYTYVNQIEADALQGDKDKVIGKDDSAFFDSDVAEAIRNTDRDVISSGKPLTREETTVFNGNTEICLSTKLPLFDGSGNTVGILGVSTNITEYKKNAQRDSSTKHMLGILASEPSAPAVLRQLIDCLTEQVADIEAVILSGDGIRPYRTGAASATSETLQMKLVAADLGFDAFRSLKAQPRLMVVDDYDKQSISKKLTDALLEDNRSCFWAIEITGSDFQHLGLLVAFPGQQRSPQGDEIDTIERVAGFVGLALERSEATQMIYAQKELLNTAIDEFPDAFLMKNYEGNYILANNAIADLYQTTPAEMIGRDDFYFTGNKQQSDAIRNNIRDVMDRMETEIVYEESTDVSSGETRYFRSIKKPILAPTGERQILVIAQDITEIERAKTQLEESNKQLNYVLNATVDAVWDWNREDDLVRHNERWNELTGFPAGSRFHSVTEFYDLIHEDDRQRVIRSTDDSKLPDHNYDIEYRLRTRDGKILWVEDYGAAVEWSEDGQPTRVVGSMSDITNRKLSEEKLNFSEKLLRTSINLSDASFTVYDPEDRLVICNDHYLDYKAKQGIKVEPGMTSREILEETSRRGFFMEAVGYEKNWVDKRMEIHSRPSSRTLLHSSDGEWYEVRTARNESDYLFIWMIDITEFIQARQRADEANQAKSRFLATMSHELRTPMNGVLGMLELLSESQLSEEQRNYVDTINQSGQTLLDIINDVLDHSKLESQMVTLESIEFDMQEMLNECAQSVGGLVKQKNLAVHFDYADDLPARFLGDPARLRQVIMNLLGNAVKFTDKGRIQISVEEEGSEEKISQMKIAISDTGIGIRDEALPILFDEFAQADQATTREFGGTGLGLAIARKLVELMGGEISVKSQLGEGSTFTVRLPLRKAADRLVTRASEEKPGDQAAETAFDANVLVVEDVPINRVVAEKFLLGLGCHVDIAENGEQAVKSVRENHYDVIFMDCRMPVMDGYQATQTIRQLESDDKRIPIIALTANSSEEDWLLCRESGMDAMITKPFRKKDLQEALTEWL